MVLFALPSLDAGGAERVATHLLRGLPRDRFDLHLALLRPTGLFLAELPADVTAHRLGERARYAGPAALRLAWRLRPDVILPWTYPMNHLLMLLKPLLPSGSRVILRLSSLASECVDAEPPTRAQWLRMRLLYPCAAAVVCPAKVMADDVIRNFRVPAGRVALIPNPVDGGAIVRQVDGRGSPFRSPGPHLVAIGRLVPQKGFDRLLDAFARAASAAAQLWILGTGPLAAPLRERAGSLGLESRVHFPGLVAEPYPWLRHADLFVQASRFEGSPNALLEALACGTRVVAYDAPGGTAEALEGAGGHVLVPDGDAAGFAAAIDRMLSAARPERPVLPARHALEPVLDQYARLLAAG